MLLPHGYEGQGPEHSSARLERYLQLCAEDNMQVCNITSPANYFHVLRRQMHRSFRKPLIIMSPKSLLRHPMAKSKAEEFVGEGHFMRILSDINGAADKDTRRVILCSGKVAYDLFGRVTRTRSRIRRSSVSSRSIPSPANRLRHVWPRCPIWKK
jgi:2-oxoglutarate dehydrogenase E1 component